ncbi:MAG: Glycogen phosphorylase [Chlamydiae bacterium]|nr:Glycogen phosphorylase [Chlamydiota bacterium]
MDTDLKSQIDMLVAKVKHYLITQMGRVNDQANDEEFYRAFAYALREEVMINWLATYQTMHKNDLRTLNYISMEYLPGRLFSNNINNIGAQELVIHVMQKMGRNYKKILAHEPDPGLGNGGLGRLASCFLDSLATHHFPVRAYGLRYQYGIFEQQIKDREQIEAPDCWLLKEYPWEFRRDLRKVSVKYGGRITETRNIHGDTIYDLHDYDEVWALPYDIPIVGYSEKGDFTVLSLKLWTTKESPRNFQLQKYNAGRLDQAAENTALTDVLYPSDWHEAGKRTRLKQEYLLVSASLQDIIRSYLQRHKNFRAFAEKTVIQINDTHPALVIPELIRLFIREYDLPWKTAIEITQQITGYTNHTILSEALEEWEQNLMAYLLPRQTRIIERLNQEFCDQIRTKYPGDEEKVRRMSIVEDGQVRMAHLSILGSHSVNGVAELHTNILRTKVFKDFYEMFPDKFFNVTNGVTQRRWLAHCNPDLASLITSRIGNGWITDFNEIQKLDDFASDPKTQEEFLSVKLKNKSSLIERLDQENTGVKETYPIIDPTSLFDVQVKRIHEYKRQLMNVLHIIMLYNDLLENPQQVRVKRTCIIAGKAAASYEIAKSIIRLINCIARRINRDTDIKGMLKMIFIQNYNVTKAGIIIPAADLSEQISTAGMEASGTGNMKLSINGALTIGTRDGANIEMEQEVTPEWWPFAFGCTSDEIEEMTRTNAYSPWDIVTNNAKIQKAIDMLRDRSFAENDQEHEAFCELYDRLLQGEYDQHPDQYFVLKDLEEYYETQKKVEKLYTHPMIWAETCLRNISHMGTFSTDRSVFDYSKKIWNISPFQPDPEIHERVSNDFREADRCRIY